MDGYIIDDFANCIKIKTNSKQSKQIVPKRFFENQNNEVLDHKNKKILQ